MSKLKGFTLAEVLITLVIIGIVSAITLPTINKQYRDQQYRAALYKALSVINQATFRYYNIYGTPPACGYWEKNPYGAAPCTSRNEQGICTKWQLADGSDLPFDYNGNFEDCNTLWRSFYKTMNNQKICTTNAYSNGCIPEYDGRDTLYAGKNPDASDYDTMVAVSSSGFLKANILSGSAIVLNDGMIFFSYMRESARYFAVDVNGHKGPNKWGYDLYVLKPTMKTATSIPKFEYSDTMLERKGHSVKKVLLCK